MSLRTIILTSILGLLTSVATASSDSLLIIGEQAYMNGHFEVAISSWTGALQQDNKNAELHYNLGNAYFRSDRLPDAILHWERTLRLAPNDKDAQYNLDLARTMLDDKIKPLPGFFLVNWYEFFVKLLPHYLWGWIAIGIIILACISLLVFRSSNRFILRRISFYSSIVLLSLSLLTLIFNWQGRHIADNDNEAIIFSPTVIVKSSPDEKGTDLFVIHEGTKVEITDRLQEWYRIKIADGNEGWVPEVVAERI